MRRKEVATEDGRGRVGDLKFMQLDVSKLEALGWKPRVNSELVVKTTVKELPLLQRKFCYKGCSWLGSFL